jgi:hypothetical protein
MFWNSILKMKNNINILLKDIYKKNINIYQILTIWKNKHKRKLPDDILEIVCRGFLKRADFIPKDKQWVYLHAALNNAWGQYNAKKNIDEAQVWKAGETMHASVKDILLKALGG